MIMYTGYARMHVMTGIIIAFTVAIDFSGLLGVRLREGFMLIVSSELDAAFSPSFNPGVWDGYGVFSSLC